MSEKRFELAYEKGNWWAVRDGDITLWKEEVIYLLNELHEENLHLQEHLDMVREQRDKLQERNDRQYNELDKLYKLIEKREWEELYAIIEDFKKSEEQLQKEWGYLG